MIKKTKVLSLILITASLSCVEKHEVNARLYQAVKNSDPAQVEYLLSLGADRTIMTPEGSLIVAAQHKISQAPAECRGYQVLEILRMYAPDEKTRVALRYVNEIRLGTFTRDYLEAQSFPDYMIEHMAYLASFDPEAQAKWVEIGMPAYF